MPSFTTLLEDTSPLLVYSQANWQAGTSNGDALFDKSVNCLNFVNIYNSTTVNCANPIPLFVIRYSDASFTLSQTKGSTMTFGFNGTSISVYGAKRGNHGQYNVTVDNFEPTTGSGASDTETFQQLLYSSGNLRSDYHNLTLLNVDGRFLDVDFVSGFSMPFLLLLNYTLDKITFTTSVGRDDEDMIINTFQNGHPAFSYNPSSSWKTPSQVERFMGGSGQCVKSSS
ncbi:hypothetical protein JR316_0001882 [Psilocybe cubensis]|uniref:Uncharacterized protein n=1 Tax=Psilocybe cubensis TaxID=181762 RepID=A0ACB8HB03_PSICU|nr:hypothetical protein JR316_0001882 [Psilocybe cubensis]KAH9484978.1 hypothetical protein JR316_0001882 [Psilocybe cubensis]